MGGRERIGWREREGKREREGIEEWESIRELGKKRERREGSMKWQTEHTCAYVFCKACFILQYMIKHVT